MNPARYAITSAFGAFAVASCVIAYPNFAFGISLVGSILVGILTMLAAAVGDSR